MRKQAFTLIELLTVIGIILILALLAIGGTQSVRKRAKVVLTNSTFSTITQALTIYREVEGDFPKTALSWTGTDINYNPSSNENEYYRLVDLLTNNLSIKDKTKSPPVVLKIVEPPLSRGELRENGMTANINGHDFFVDAWGNYILYYYAANLTSSSAHPYTDFSTNPYPPSIKYDCRLFDLISAGPDGDYQTKNDNITNF
ncbi:MAG: prepilin-type N-terminal cleavage/methylation domain-containing protein [Candidatus Aureabacteria bacterium]|nr:prepilin-type N-terminal cleavage/methylation domain-containing protein [Candidatus Auribacterota bacterium]